MTDLRSFGILCIQMYREFWYFNDFALLFRIQSFSFFFVPTSDEYQWIDLIFLLPLNVEPVSNDLFFNAIFFLFLFSYHSIFRIISIESLKVWKELSESTKYTAYNRKSFLHYVNCLWECVETSSITKLVPLYSGMDYIVADNKMPDSWQWFLAIV